MPGPNAAVLALTLSGLPPHPFLFLGLPAAEAGRPPHRLRRAARGRAGGLSAALIWHEAPHRLAETLADLESVFGDRPAAIARELTKRFEEVRRGRLPGLVRALRRKRRPGARSRCCSAPAPPRPADAEDLDRQLRRALATHSVKDAAALVAGATGLPRRTVYARALELAGQG